MNVVPLKPLLLFLFYLLADFYVHTPMCLLLLHHAHKHITTFNVAADSAAVSATTAADIATAAAVCSPDCDDGLRANMNRDLTA